MTLDETVKEIVVEATAPRLRMGDFAHNYETMLSLTRDAAKRGVDLIVFPEMATTGYAVGDELEMEEFLANNERVVEKLRRETRSLDIAIALGYVRYDKERTAGDGRLDPGHALEHHFIAAERERHGHDGRLRRYNSAVVLQRGEVRGITDKTLLPNYTLFDERRWFTPGNQDQSPAVSSIDVRGKTIRLGIGICEMKWIDDYERMVQEDYAHYKEELWDGVGVKSYIRAQETFNLQQKELTANPAKKLAREGAELLVWLNASPFHAGKNAKIDSINRARIAEAGLPMVDVNLVGIGDNTRDLFGFSGESSILDAAGNSIVMTRPWASESVIARVQLPDGTAEAIRGEGGRHLYNSLAEFIASTRGPVLTSYPHTLPSDAATRYVDEALFATIAIAGMYVEETGMRAVHESMSGGIDSSLGTAIAEIARRAGYFDELHVATFPTASYTTGTTLNYARTVAKNLGLALMEEPIQKEFEYRMHTLAKRAVDAGRRTQEQLEAAVQQSNDIDIDTGKRIGVKAYYSMLERSVTAENIQARIRSERMKQRTNDWGGLEFVNPNKDERRQGYTTLWGDMAGDLMVIGDYDKWLVRAAAHRLNELNGSELIPATLINSLNPSAELSDAHNPEQGGGDPFDYVALGLVLDGFTHNRMDVPELARAFAERRLPLNGMPEEFAERVYDQFSPEEFADYASSTLQRMELMRYKNVVAPLTPRVTRRALGFELRTPVTSRYFRSAQRRAERGF